MDVCDIGDAVDAISFASHVYLRRKSWEGTCGEEGVTSEEGGWTGKAEGGERKRRHVAIG